MPAAETLPLTPHGWPAEFYEELAHAHWAYIIIDLCVGSGAMARVALEKQLKYVGICQSVCQQQWLEEKLTDHLLTLMADTNSPFYTASYVETKNRQATGGVPAPTPTPRPAPIAGTPAPTPAPNAGQPATGALAVMLEQARARMNGLNT